MAEARLLEPQQFPVFFPGSAPFLDANGQPSGARGAVATVTLEVNLRPQWITGIRANNVYEVPAGDVGVGTMELLDKMDGFQSMTTEQSIQNIIVRDAVQILVMGRSQLHWHPLPCPYPWRGGNNITFIFRRLASYPGFVFPTAHVLLEGIQLLDDRAERKGT